MPLPKQEAKSAFNIKEEGGYSSKAHMTGKKVRNFKCTSMCSKRHCGCRPQNRTKKMKYGLKQMLERHERLHAAAAAAADQAINVQVWLKAYLMKFKGVPLILYSRSKVCHRARMRDEEINTTKDKNFYVGNERCQTSIPLAILQLHIECQVVLKNDFHYVVA
jgi:hypothetical protein